MKMTPAELAEIEERLKRITPGEWSVRSQFKGAPFHIYSNKYGRILLGGSIQADHDAKFIAHAPASTSTLIKAVRELEQSIVTKDAAIKRTLAYLRSPDHIDAELIERMLDRALTPNGKDEMSSVFEMVDSSSDETYHPIGIFMSLADAIAAIDGLGPKEIFDDPEEFCSIEIREREIGFSEHGKAVFVRKWAGEWSNTEDDYIWRIL